MAIEMFSELLSTLGEAAGTAAENYVRSLNPLAPFIRAANLAGIKIMIGGAPITAEFAREIGADGFAPDAASAVDLARKMVAA